MKKLFIAIMIVSLLSISVPQKVEAQYIDIMNLAKEFPLDTIATVIGKIMLKKLTAQTVNWINSGFKGKPAFITDSNQFFLDIGDNTASQFLSETQLNKLCSPFKAEVRLALVKNYIQEDNYTCTLDTLKNNYDAFISDFSKGGWTGWFEMTQTSAGNPYSAYLAAESKLLTTVQNNKARKETQLDQSGGLLSLEKCKEGMEMTMEKAKRLTGANFSDILTPGFLESQGLPELGECAESEKETVTPGIAIDKALGDSLGSGWRQLQAADEINEILTALVSQFMSKVFGDKGGLAGVSKSSNSSPSFTSQLENEPEPPPIDPGQLQITPTTMVCLTNEDTGEQTCEIKPGIIKGPEWLENIVPIDGETGKGPGTPGEIPPGLSGICDSIASERGKFPAGTISRENIRTIIENAAGSNNASGWGMLEKKSGANCTGVSCDIVFHGPTCYIYDVLGSATGSGDLGGPATPQCNFAGGNMDRSRWVGVGSDTRGSGPCAVVIPEGGTPPGGKSPCLTTGNIYASFLREALTFTLEKNQALANSLNNKENSLKFLALVVEELKIFGVNATEKVLNGNNNPSSGDLIAIWKTGDTTMERYDAIIGVNAGDRTIASAVTSEQFVGFIPLNCTISGGGTNCGCPTTPPPPAPIVPTVNLSVSPSSIVPGSSSIITWSSNNATSCTSSGAWTGTRAISGSQTVSPTVTSTYTISCSGTGGTKSQSVQLTVSTGTPPISPITLPSDYFTFVVIPDTQGYTAYDSVNYKGFTNITNWIVKNFSGLKIKAAAQVGDLISESYQAYQWVNASNAMKILDDAKVPYGILAGNHDFSTTTPQTTDVFARYFPVSRYNKNFWWGGSSDSNNSNSYILFSGGGENYVLISMRYTTPSNRVADATWANSIIKKYPSSKIILSTHAYLNYQGLRQYQDQTNGGPITSYENLWTDIVYPNSNVFMVISGHDMPKGEASRIDKNITGKNVYQLLSNYQSNGAGGQGRLRKMTFAPSQNKIYIQTLATSLATTTCIDGTIGKNMKYRVDGCYETDSNSEFILDLNTGTVNPGPFELKLP
ncbi:MAG: metallophosphoesterase [Candidatus Paceibacterota bacterium]|jgi:hypothetical protein